MPLSSSGSRREFVADGWVEVSGYSVGETMSMRRWRKSFWELKRGLIDVIVAGLGRGLLVHIMNGVLLVVCECQRWCWLPQIGWLPFDLIYPWENVYV